LIREALMRGVAGIAAAVEDDLARRLPEMNVARRRGISQVVAAMLTVRSANMVELGNVLPREIASWEKRYQFVERVLGNAKTDCDEVMASFAAQVAGALSAAGETLIVMMDQSHINDLNEVLMVSLGFRGRALPVAWRVKSTQGGIGFEVQEELLAAVKAMLPRDAAILLSADRFYGTPALVDWCVAAGWDYRIRLKSNLTLTHEGGEMATGEVLGLAPEGLDLRQALRQVCGHQHLRLARGGTPRAVDHRHGGQARTRDLSRLWPALGHRGDVLGLQVTRLRSDAEPDPTPGPAGKTDSDHGDSDVLGGLLRACGRSRIEPEPNIKKNARSLCSLFKRGLRFFKRYFALAVRLPKLWGRWNL